MRCFWVVVVGLAGCRGILGIDEPTVTADAGDKLDARMNCTGDDYDSDGTPDGCDLCPMLPDAAGDRDADGDGVGDACDPNPELPGDKRVAWLRFDSDADIAAWTKNGGAWSVVNGALRQSSSMGVAAIGPPGLYSKVYVMTRIDVTSRGSTPSAGLCTYNRGTDFKCCDLRSPQMTTVELAAYDSMTTSVVDAPVAFQTGTSIEITNRATDAMLDCTLRSGTLSPEASAVAGGDKPGLVALHTSAAAVAFRYLFIVQMP